MEDDSTGKNCLWHCTCKVMLGKRSYYQECKSYLQQLNPNESQTKERTTSSSSQNEENFTDTPEESHVDQETAALANFLQIYDNTASENSVSKSLNRTIPNGEKVENDLEAPESDNKEVIIEPVVCDENTGNNKFEENISEALKTSSTYLKSSNKLENEPVYQNITKKSSQTEKSTSPIITSTIQFRNRSQFHKCTICGKSFGQLLSLERHEKEHVLESYKNFTCPDCNKQYETVASYDRHIKKHPKCILCGKSMTPKEVESQPEEENGLHVNVCKKCRSEDAPVIFKRKLSSGSNSLLSKDHQSINLPTNGFDQFEKAIAVNQKSTLPKLKEPINFFGTTPTNNEPQEDIIFEASELISLGFDNDQFLLEDEEMF